MAHITPAALPKGSALCLCWLGLSAVAAAAGIASPALPSPWWPHRCARQGPRVPRIYPLTNEVGCWNRKPLSAFIYLPGILILELSHSIVCALG